MARAAMTFANERIGPGERRRIELQLPGLYTDTPVTMPVHVLHGRGNGPTVFVSAAVHGDEINGVEIIRRLLLQPQLRRLHGTVLLAPIVNVLGFHNRSRYLPDRRDLNRSFPGREDGSLASRLAHRFLVDVVQNSDIGIDLHTAAIHRENLPQTRADMKLAPLETLCQRFAAPVTIHSAPPEGSLRHTAAELGVPILVYEAGEALRFDEFSIRVGLRGVLNVLRELGMIRMRRKVPTRGTVVRSSIWVRAPRSGIARVLVKPGDIVRREQVLAHLSDAGGEGEAVLRSPCDGVIIGRTTLPLVYAGEAMFHIGRSIDTERLEARLEEVQNPDQFDTAALIEEPEIV